MRKLKERPYNFLLITTGLLLCLGLFTFNYPVDFLLHDTYFVLSMKYIILLLILILILIWLVYLQTTHLLSLRILTLSHILLTIVSALFITITPLLSQYTSVGGAGAPRRYFDFHQFANSYKLFGNMTHIIIRGFTIMFLGQAIFVVHLFIGIYKGFRARYHRIQ